MSPIATRMQLNIVIFHKRYHMHLLHGNVSSLPLDAYTRQIRESHFENADHSHLRSVTMLLRL